MASTMIQHLDNMRKSARRRHRRNGHDMLKFSSVDRSFTGRGLQSFSICRKCIQWTWADTRDGLLGMALHNKCSGSAI